jgi:hypothetical protein
MKRGSRGVRQVKATLGDLIAAAYDAAGGGKKGALRVLGSRELSRYVRQRIVLQKPGSARRTTAP